MIRHASLIVAAMTSATVAASAQHARQRATELDRLSDLVGVFEGEVRIDRQNASPIVGTMRYVAQWELDSSWVVARYEQTLMGRKTSGVLMYSWDAALRKFMFYGFPNNPMEPHRLRGSLEGNTLVFESDTAAASRYRETWGLVGRDTLVTSLSGIQNNEWVSGPRAVLVRRRR